MTNGASVIELKGHTSPVHSVAFSPDGKKVVTASGDQTGRIWDTESGKELQELWGHFAPVISAAFSPDGKRIVTLSADTNVKIWDTESGNVLKTLHGHVGYVLSATFSPDGTKIITAGNDKTARIWCVDSGEMLQKLDGHAGAVYFATFSPDGKRIVTTGGGAVRTTSFMGFPAPLVGDRTARVWDAETGREVQKLTGYTGTDTLIFASFSPDGSKIVTACRGEGQTIVIWDADSGKALKALQVNYPKSVAFAPDSKTVVVWGKIAIVWDIEEEGECNNRIRKLDAHTSGVTFAAFSPNGKMLVTTSYDNTARIWDADSGEELRNLEGHAKWIVGAAFSPDGKKVATASADNTVRIWNLEEE